MPVRDLAGVKKQLKQLGRPRPGFVRLFRGQDRTYPTLLPTARRPNSSWDLRRVWKVYAHKLSLCLSKETPTDRGQAALDTFAYWLNAMAQHYGGGSEYLDVTHDLEIALWFALHKVRKILVDGKEVVPESIGIFGNTEAENFPFRHKVIRFEPVDTGYLYVFDVPRARTAVAPAERGDSQVEHQLTYVDVCEAPPPFASPRVKSQAACLLVAQQDLNDWAPLALGPIEVGRPMSGSSKMHLETKDLFPAPSVDPWYDRFLSLPNVPHFEKEGVIFRFPIPLDLYLSDRSDHEEFAKRVFALNPPFLSSGPLANDLKKERVGSLWRVKKLKDAAKIVLQGPISAAAPSPESGVWNHELLLSGFPESAPVIDLVTGRRAEPLRLDNLFFELSPLESVGWDRESQNLVRAIWLVIEAGIFQMKLFVQKFPYGGFVASEMLRIAFDPSARRFRRLQDGTMFDLPSQELRHFLPILAMLRELNDGWKVMAHHDLILGRATSPGTGKAIYRVTGSATAAAQMERVWQGWYIIREKVSGGPYVIPGVYANPITFTVQASAPFSDIPGRAIRSEFLNAIIRSGVPLQLTL